MVKHGATFNPDERITQVEAKTPEQAIAKVLSSLHHGDVYATATAECIHDNMYDVRVKIA